MHDSATPWCSIGGTSHTGCLCCWHRGGGAEAKQYLSVRTHVPMHTPCCELKGCCRVHSVCQQCVTVTPRKGTASSRCLLHAMTVSYIQIMVSISPSYTSVTLHYSVLLARCAKQPHSARSQHWPCTRLPATHRAMQLQQTSRQHLSNAPQDLLHEPQESQHTSCMPG